MDGIIMCIKWSNEEATWQHFIGINTLFHNDRGINILFFFVQSLIFNIAFIFHWIAHQEYPSSAKNNDRNSNKMQSWSILNKLHQKVWHYCGFKKKLKIVFRKWDNSITVDWPHRSEIFVFFETSFVLFW